MQCIRRHRSDMCLSQKLRQVSKTQSHIPELFDFADPQYDIEIGSSYWLSSFITGTNVKQYLAISHTLNYWVDLTYCTPQAKAATALDKASPLNLDFGTYGYKATSDDGISKMAAHFQLMLNGGGGIIDPGTRPTNATHWGIPSSKTEGSLTVGDEVFKVDPKNSFTRYDRQLSHGTPKNWTSFHVNFPGTAIKASIWAFDTDTTSKQFATVRVDELIHVLAFTLTPDMTNTWTSPNTNLVYSLAWRLDFDNGDYLKVKSVHAGQEMYGSRHVADSAYEGFVTVSGRFMGQKKGFGVVELVTVYQ
ncbi:hypothetical protein EDB80DRAFT_754894 [Ilyonectria destructans]|nr:hypothetical protein EDB80DRAFT_754894 [Ilyonectria destructans]